MNTATLSARFATLGTLESWLAALYSPFALATRLFVAWVFFKSGLLKVSDWSSTLFLFSEEYRVPWLPPDVAAVLGTAGELTLPILLVLGLFGRLSALAMSLLNAFAVISYAHVLFAEGFEAAIAQHYLWGFMLLTLTFAGLGQWRVRMPHERVR